MAPVFDTNIVIDWLRRCPETALELAHYPNHRISRVTWAEVLAGEGPGARQRVAVLIEPFDVIEVAERTAALAADIRHRLRLKLMDAFIYATAQAAGTVLVTRNTKDFPADMPGVRVPYVI